ncbi:DUF3352 domain-containing protein, partial [bacterium]|nr:DUF3352 domain-containing protein [bacterium]
MRIYQQKILWFFLVLAIIIIALGLGLYFLEKPQDEIMKIVPQKAVFYSQLNLNQKKVGFLDYNFKKENLWSKWLTQKDGHRKLYLDFFKDFNQKLKSIDLDMENDIVPLVKDKIALAYLLDNAEPNLVLFIPVKNKTRAENILEKLRNKKVNSKTADYQSYQIKKANLSSPIDFWQKKIDFFYYTFINRRYLVISFKENLIKEIIKTKKKYQPSLADLIFFQEKRKVEPGEIFVKAYLDFSYFCQFLKEKKNDIVVQNILSLLREKEKDKWLELTFALQKNNVSWKIEEIGKAELSYFQYGREIFNWKKFIFQPPLFFVSGINWKNKLSKFLEKENKFDEFI